MVLFQRSSVPEQLILCW